MATPVGTNRTNQRLLAGAAPKRESASSKEAFVANVAEKRYLWTARAFAIITAISMCCNIILLLAITQVIPLYRVEPFLVTFQNKEEQVYNIQPVNQNLAEAKNITEVFVRQYVLMRSSFNRDIPEVEAQEMICLPEQKALCGFWVQQSMPSIDMKNCLQKPESKAGISWC